MDPADRKTALRTIPYGLYVLSAEAGGRVAASTVNWVTQASFEPPLLAVGVKADSTAHAVLRESGAFALNVLGKDQQAIAYDFFKPVERVGAEIAGHRFRAGETGSPLLEAALAALECRVVDVVERGDHALFVGHVVAAHVPRAIEGRPDDATLWLRELGPKTFYGG
jgi:flavin reductase (DIM6/NTAB) family NADH-FMN oxidoreductase RutF